MMMTRMIDILLCAFLVIGMAGCDLPLTQQEAEEGIAMVSNEMSGTLSNDVMEKQCQTSGQLQVRRTVSSVEFLFSECTAGELSVNGDLVASVSQEGVGVAARMEGRLFFSGSIKGTCLVYTRANLDLLSGFEYFGDVCGFESPELVTMLLDPIIEDLLDAFGF